MGAELEIEDIVELIDLFGFLVERGGQELGDFLLADQDLV